MSDPNDILVYRDRSQEIEKDGTAKDQGATWVNKLSNGWFEMNRCSLGTM